MEPFRQSPTPPVDLCPTCGRQLDERSARTWGNDVLTQVEGVGAFVRSLLPVRLSGGHTLTYGLWLGVHRDDLHRAYSTWMSESYVDLVLDGLVANDVQPWGLLGKPARAIVRDPDHTPYLHSSSDDVLTAVLSDEWPHDLVPATLR